MLKQVSLLLALLTVMFISMGTQCWKDDDAVQPKQYFLEKVTLSPAQKIYSVNDTIWLNYATNNKTFFDKKSGKRLPTDDIKFYFGATLIPKYETPENPSDGFCRFILPNNISTQPITNQSGTLIYFDIDCDNTLAYNIKLGIVLKYQGIYILHLPDGISLQACAGQTNPYPGARLQFIYDLSDCNKDIYLSIPSTLRKEYPPGFTENQIGDKVAFALKVQ